ncbi:MAG TPA: hypothetical protein ENN07_00240 [candidate division Zixibacteria bacterium]|nr:hypothetical protein [candidate division Zixibacteria bacterium]
MKKWDSVETLIDKGLVEDAFKELSQRPRPLSLDESFYLAYCQATLGHDFEAMNTLLELKESCEEDCVKATISGFLADVLRNNGFINDALSEVKEAITLDPEDELIKALFDEIIDDWWDDNGNYVLLFTLLSVLRNRKKRATKSAT